MTHCASTSKHFCVEEIKEQKYTCGKCLAAKGIYFCRDRYTAPEARWRQHCLCSACFDSFLELCGDDSCHVKNSIDNK